ncbi:MAG TPA: hypothetical protein VFW50_18835 [Streptosporangiaceae bacterium]|nr:hypothetical protein [Streptosporangiaceae bacterium]
MRWQKVLGLAAFAGVAATGAVIVRDERRRRAYTPDQVRDRLHTRLARTTEKPQHPKGS